MRRTTFLVLTVVLGSLLFGVALTRRLIDSAANPNADRSSSGAYAPLTDGRGVVVKFSDHPVALPPMRVTALDGSVIDPATWGDKVVLLNFWATWCGPCREEIPALIALQKRYAGRLLIIGLSIDERPTNEVKAFAEQFGVNYPVAIASSALQQAFGGIASIPATFVVDTKGQIVQQHAGAIATQMVEHEVRLLAGLPTEATSETVKDTGQVLRANTAFATEIPGVDLTGLTIAQKDRTLQRLNVEHCTCGCGLTLAQCRIQDPTCDVSLPLAQAVAKAERGK